MSKFIIFTLLTVFLSASFIVGLDQVSHTLLTNYLFQSDYMIEQEKRPLKKLQVWINKNNVQTDDLIKLDNYCDEHQFPYLVIMKKGHVVYDWNLQDMVNTRLYPAVPGLEIDRLWRFYQPVHFKNGTAYVFIDNGLENHLYQLTTVMATVMGVFLGMGAYVLYLKKKIKQIIYINDMVEKLRNKDYTHDIRVSGTDEIGELAAHVDILRQRLAEDVQKEKVIKEENYMMISGMVHDLRQPLANIQLYVDILSEKQEASRNVGRIRKNIKALQVLSDELFEYILLHNKEKVILEKPEKLFSAIGDDLSNMYAMLEEKEFHIDDHDLVFYKADIQVNHEYIMRICNNIYSNLIKYADQNIKMYSCINDDQVVIGIKNKIKMNSPHQGTGIGIKNIQMMMKQMNGACVIKQEEEAYTIELMFPLVK